MNVSVKCCHGVNGRAAYAVIERHADGQQRIVAELSDAIAAYALTARLRGAGADASVHLLADRE